MLNLFVYAMTLKQQDRYFMTKVIIKNRFGIFLTLQSVSYCEDAYFFFFLNLEVSDNFLC